MHVTVRIDGINLEKLLRSAGEAGIVLTSVQRMGGREMRVRIRADQLALLNEICDRFGWAHEEMHAGGLVRIARFLQRRCMLVPAVLLGCALVFLSSKMILRVRVVGAGEHIAGVYRVLEEEGVRPGRFKSAFSLDALRAQLAYRLPGLAFSGLRYAGSVLVCDCRSAVEGEVLEIPGESGDIVAAQPGIITDIAASSGTPQVEPGQAVRKGQVLIAGWERTQKGEQRGVRAEGLVRARVFAHGEAKVSLNTVRTVETGRTRTRVIISTPWHTRVVHDAQPFASQDVSSRVEPVVGLYLPLWRVIETYAETQIFTEQRNRGDAASMAQGAAEEIAKEQCPPGALILDKWVNYSMIDNEFVYAMVVLEAETNIAGRME